jgi:GAF domain-containing protein
MSLVDDPHHNSGAQSSLDEHGRLLTCARVLLPTLGSITAAAAARPGLTPFMQAVVDHGSIIAIRGTRMWSLEDRYLRLIAAGGYAATDVARYAQLPLTANLPCSDAVSDRVAVICRDRHELFAKYPLTDRFVVKTHGLVSLPIIRQDNVVAGISFHFDSPVHIDDTALTFLQSIADLAAVLLDTEVAPLADVLPFTVIHSPTPYPDVEQDDLDEGPEEPAAIASRLDALERQMRSMRQMMMFLGAIANDRFDETR